MAQAWAALDGKVRDVLAGIVAVHRTTSDKAKLRSALEKDPLSTMEVLGQAAAALTQATPGSNNSSTAALHLANLLFMHRSYFAQFAPPTAPNPPAKK